MNRTRRKPVLSTTVELLIEHIRAQSLQPGDALPSIRAIAGMTGVSPVTVQRALRALERTGRIHAADRRKYTVAESGPGSLPAPAKTSRTLEPVAQPWQRVADAVRSDIRNGAFAPGTGFPSMKEMQRRYRVSYRTVKRALLRLAVEHCVDKLTNGAFVVPAFSSVAWRPHIVCFVQSTDSFTMAFGQNDEAMFRAFETQCELAHIKIDAHLIFFDYQLKHQRFRHTATGRIYDAEDLVRWDDGSALGYVYFIPWHPSVIDEKAVPLLAARKKPLVILDETQLLRLPDAVAGLSRVRHLTIGASSEPARAVARHLLMLGHRRIAYITTDHFHLWSRRRHDELRAEISAADGDAMFTSFVATVVPNFNAHVEACCNFAALEQFYGQWKKDVPAPIRAEMDYAVGRLRVDTAGRAEHRFALEPLLEQALATPGVTAWVMSSDFVASMALSYLKDKGIRVPKDVSLISFDDSREALRSNLSSYNFNPGAFAASVLGFILKRKPFIDANTTITGFIADRGSTGPVTLLTEG